MKNLFFPVFFVALLATLPAHTKDRKPAPETPGRKVAVTAPVASSCRETCEEHFLSCVEKDQLSEAVNAECSMKLDRCKVTCGKSRSATAFDGI